MKYCYHCDWSITADEVPSAEERSAEALEHFLETGHSIDSIDHPRELRAGQETP